MKNPDILAATKPDAEAFEKLGILYYIGGSVASSTVKLNHSPKVSGLTNQSSDDVLVRVENVSKKFCRDLKRSLWYGIAVSGQRAALPSAR